MVMQTQDPPPEILDGAGQRLTKDTSALPTEQADFKLDREWAKQAFLINGIDLDNTPDPALGVTDRSNRWTTTARMKFVDTTMGGALGINARPQFTRYADIREKGRMANRVDVTLGNTSGNYGMGRYYSEAIDDNAQTIYLRFGVPQFNSITRFMTGAFDPDLATLARTGRGSTIFYQAASALGTVTTLYAFPVLSFALFSAKAYNMFFRSSVSKFYTLKPTMHTYWGAVNNLVNSIGVNLGILPSHMPFSEPIKDQLIGTQYQVDNVMLKQLHDLMPNMFTEGFGFDIFAMATRAQMMANHLAELDYQNYNNGTDTDFLGHVKKSYQEKLVNPPGAPSLVNWVNTYMKIEHYMSAEPSADNADSKSKGSTMEKMISVDNKGNLTSTVVKDGDGKVVNGPDGKPLDNTDTPVGDIKKYFADLGKQLDAEARQGADFAIFKVDGTGSVSEAFGNSAVESDLANKINGISSTSREARFTFADGNISDEGVAGLMQDALGAVKDTVMGFAQGATFGAFGAIRALAGDGFIDIPKHWQSSTATLPRSNYTMSLVSPYGNVFSQMQNIYIPLAMVLAGALPLSTGKQSYTSPFLVQLYDRGRCQIQTGIIESVSISRGTTNLPFTARGKALGIEVTFTVADLSSIMHMPIPAGSIFGVTTEDDPDNILMDYLSVLAGQDIYSQIYRLPKAKLALAKKILRVERLTSPAWMASYINEETTSGWMRWLLPVSVPYQLDKLVNAGTSTTNNPGVMP